MDQEEILLKLISNRLQAINDVSVAQKENIILDIRKVAKGANINVITIYDREYKRLYWGSKESIERND